MKKGLLVFGSRSDYDKVIEFLRKGKWNLRLIADICSCHRNPLATLFLALRILLCGYNFVVCVGGKAFALPGVLDAWIYFFSKIIFWKKPVLVIAVVMGKPDSRSLLAADLSVVEIPGSTVLTESEDHSYSGIDGLGSVLSLAEQDSLPKEQKPRTKKPAERRIWKNY